MAVRILTTDGTLSTGTWYSCEASNFPFGNSTNSRDSLSTERTIAVTFANAGNQVGLVVCLAIYSSTGWASDTITVKLQENVASVWTTRTTDTYAITGTYVGFPGKYNFIYVPLTSYAVDTTASKWRYSIQGGGSSVYQLVKNTTYMYAVALDYSTANPSSADTIIVADGKTLTLDQSFTFGATGTCSLCWCKDANIFSAGGASYTFTFNHQILQSASGSFKVGTELSPVLAANRCTIDGSAIPSSYSLFGHSSPNQTGAYGGGVIELWGAESTIMDRVASNATVGQKNVVTRTDLSSTWSAGDSIQFHGSEDQTVYVIDSISGTTITTTVNLAKTIYEGSSIINITSGQNDLGIKVIEHTNGGYFNYQVMRYFKYVGVWFNGCKPSHSATDPNYTDASLMRGCFFNPYATAARGIFSNPQVVSGSSVYSLTISNCVQYVRSSDSSSGAVQLTYGYNCTLSNISTTGITAGGVNSMLQECVNSTVSGFVVEMSQNSPTTFIRPAFYLLNSNLGTITDSYIEGGLGLTLNSSKFTITNSWIQTRITGTYSNGYAVAVLSGTENIFDTCYINKNSSSSTADFYLGTYAYAQVIVYDTTMRTSTISNMSNAVNGSFIKFHNVNAVSNEHQVDNPYGVIHSSGDALIDTTVHTSGTGKYAVRFAPSSSSNNLIWDFDIPTGNISTKTMTVSVWCKINSATYYAGTHQLPRLTINYDNGTTAYHQAGETTDWQLLFVSFTPTTTYGQITVTLSGRTDATSTNAYIYWDDFAVAYPPSVALDLGGMDNWANALPVTPPIALPISAGTVAQSVWQQLTTTSWGTNSMGEQVKAIPGEIKYIDSGEIPLY